MNDSSPFGFFNPSSTHVLFLISVLAGSISGCSFGVPAEPDAKALAAEIRVRDASTSAPQMEQDPGSRLDMGVADQRQANPSNIVNVDSRPPPELARIEVMETDGWIPLNEDGHPVIRVGSVRIGTGVISNVVADEVLIGAEHVSEIESLMREHNLSLVRTVNIGTQQLIYVLKRRGLAMSVDQANRMLEAAHVQLDDTIFVSDAVTLSTIAIVTLELSRGTPIALNPVLFPTLVSGPSEEGSSREDGYQSDARQWSYLSNAAPYQYDVVGAWDRLVQANSVSESVSVAVIDRGFQINPDLSERMVLASTATVEPHPDSPRHGTLVAGTITAHRNDHFGVVGVAAPVAKVTAYPLTEMTLLGALLRIAQAAEAGERIINLSWTGNEPIFLPEAQNMHLLAAATQTLSRRSLIITSAGNSGVNLDQELVRQMPCSLPGVVCVGGMDSNTDEFHQESNYSLNEVAQVVDLYAPFQVFGSPEPDADIVTISGTSMSSAYVSGVAALIAAAHPSASSRELLNALVDTATQSGVAPGIRVVSPGAAIADLIGNLPPIIQAIRTEGEAENVGPNDIVHLVTEFTDLDDPDGCTIEWESDLAGFLGTGSHLSTHLAFIGTHEVRAVVTDPQGETAVGIMQVSITDQAPYIDVIHPREGTTVQRSRPTIFTAQGHDEDLEPSLLSCERLVWFVIPPGGTFQELGSGCDVQVPAMNPGLGFLRIELNGAVEENVWLIHPFEVR